MQPTFQKFPQRANIEIFKIDGTTQYIVRHQNQDINFITLEDAQRYAKTLVKGIQSPFSIRTLLTGEGI